MFQYEDLGFQELIFVLILWSMTFVLISALLGDGTSQA